MDNKTLIDTISRNTALGKKETARLLESLADIIRDTASDMDSIAIPAFGTFEPKKRLERVMAVPSTGKRLLIPPKITLSFRPSAILKQQLRESKKS